MEKSCRSSLKRSIHGPNKKWPGHVGNECLDRGAGFERRSHVPIMDPPDPRENVLRPYRLEIARRHDGRVVREKTKGTAQKHEQVLGIGVLRPSKSEAKFTQFRLGLGVGRALASPEPEAPVERP